MKKKAKRKLSLDRLETRAAVFFPRNSKRKLFSLLADVISQMLCPNLLRTEAWGERASSRANDRAVHRSLTNATEKLPSCLPHLRHGASMPYDIEANRETQAKSTSKYSSHESLGSSRLYFTWPRKCMEST